MLLALLVVVVLAQDAPSEPEALRPIDLPDFPEGAAYLLGRLSNEELVGVQRSVPVYRAILGRAELDLAYREGALRALALEHGTSRLRELIEAIARAESAGEEAPAALEDLLHMLTASPPVALGRERGALNELATTTERGQATRRAALAAMVVADGTLEEVRALSVQQPHSTLELLSCLPMIPDPNLRSQFQPMVTGLVEHAPGAQLRHAAIRACAHIPGHEEENFLSLARIYANGDLADREAVVAALVAMPSASWPAEGAGQLAGALMSRLLKVPSTQRSAPEFKRALHLGHQLAGRLAPRSARELRGLLGELGVRTITVRVLPHILQFDSKHLVVEAGETFELVFENPGVMTHNLVLCAPGALESVGRAADRMVGAPAHTDGRRFVPELDAVLASTPIVRPRGATSLTIEAPDSPGEFPYMCTVPGHWARMNGTLHVVEDVQRWTAENISLLTSDERAKFVRAWSLDDLTNELGRLAGEPGMERSPERSLDRGRAHFSESCAICHKVRGEGEDVGPDLTEATGRLGQVEMLEHILFPSMRIADEYSIWAVEMRDGEMLYGRVVDQDGMRIVLVEDPRLPTPPIELPRAEVSAMHRTPTSTMPMGLLNTMRLEEILDLLAYVRSGPQ